MNGHIKKLSILCKSKGLALWTSPGHYELNQPTYVIRPADSSVALFQGALKRCRVFVNDYSV